MLLLQQLMEFGQFHATLTAINGIWSVPRYSYSNYWNLVSSSLILQQIMAFGQFLATLTAINGIWSVPRYSYSN